MKYDFIIVGSGIIGLALAYKLKKKFNNSKILILEKEKDSIQHGSGRNSGVIHSGIYSVSYTHLTLPTIYSV